MDEPRFDFRHHRLSVDLHDTPEGWSLTLFHEDLSQPEQVTQGDTYRTLSRAEAVQVAQDATAALVLAMLEAQGLLDS